MTTRTCAADVEALRAYAEGVGDLAFGLQGDAHALSAALMHLGRTRSEGLPPLPLLADDVAELAGDMTDVASSAARTAAAFDEAGGGAALSWFTTAIDAQLTAAGVYDDMVPESSTTWGARVRGALGIAAAGWTFVGATQEQWHLDGCSQASSITRAGRAALGGAVVTWYQQRGSNIGGAAGGGMGMRAPLPPKGRLVTTGLGKVAGGAYGGARAEAAGKRERDRILDNEPAGSCAEKNGEDATTRR